MTLEVLFARQGQSAAFLRMVICGLAAGVVLDVCLLLCRRRPGLTVLWDVLAAILCGAMLLPAVLLAGEGLRAYELLGLALGGALYAAGLRTVLSAIGRRLRKDTKTNAPKAGDSNGPDES